MKKRNYYYAKKKLEVESEISNDPLEVLCAQNFDSSHALEVNPSWSVLKYE